MNKIRNAGTHKRLAVITVTVVMAITALLNVASPTAALAAAAPRGIFAPFAQCPTSVPGVRLCQYAEITSGEWTIGPMRIPIDKTMILQGGSIPTGGPNPNEFFVLPAVNGQSISPTELNVPGGLHTLIGCPTRWDRDHHHHHHSFSHDPCNRTPFHDGWEDDDLTVRVEPAASPTNPAILTLSALIQETGPALTFPAKLHLKNPFLGEDCYIGSEAHPIEPHFTDGTTSPPPPNQPITGKLGKLTGEEEEGYETIKITENTLVDNAFSVPPAEGCGGGSEHHTAIIDAMIDHTLGLESPAGHNTAILNGTHTAANPEAVLASETFPTKEEENPPPPTHHHHHHHSWWPTH
jgi:hypothetical protein